MLVERKFYLQKLIARKHNGRIKIITGIRRCGKSVLLFDLFKSHLITSGIQEHQIIILKLDIATNARYRNPLELDKYIRNQIKDSTTQYYILIDEIQEIKAIPNPWLDNKTATIGFVDTLLGLLELKNADIYVTGSNSKMLSSDILTEFKDRGDEIHVWPFTYNEFYSVCGNKSDAWIEYTRYGGMPRIISENTDDDKSKYLLDLISKTYLTDVIERNRLNSDISLLNDLLNIIASCIGSLTNPTKLENTFSSVLKKKVSDSTISTWLEHFADAFIIHKAYQYNIKGRKYIGSPLKYYFTDIGLRNAHLNFRQQEETHIMENILFNELCARGYNVDIGIIEYNYKDTEGKSRRSKLEVDFVVNKGNSKCYIQSAFAIPNEDKRNQETLPLCRIDDTYKKIVVQGNKIKPWYDDRGIYYVGIEDFLLNYIDKLL